MQEDKQYDIKASLKDIEQSIQEINEFLPIERNYFAFQNYLKHERQLNETLRLLVRQWIGFLKLTMIFISQIQERLLIPESGLIMVTIAFQLMLSG